MNDPLTSDQARARLRQSLPDFWTHEVIEQGRYQPGVGRTVVRKIRLFGPSGPGLLYMIEGTDFGPAVRAALHAIENDAEGWETCATTRLIDDS